MKEELRGLATQLLTSPPKDFFSLYNRFVHYDHLFNQSSPLPQEAHALWLCLNDFRTLLLRWKSNTDKQAARAAIIDEQKSNQSEIRQINESLKAHELGASQLKEQLEEPYQQLHSVYAKIQSQKEPLLALPVYTGLREREVLISRLEETLTKELNAIKFDDLKLILNKNWLRINDIQKQLKALHIDLISYRNIELLRGELENIQSQIAGQERYLQAFTRYSQHLKDSLSHQDLSSTISQLSNELEASRQTLREITNDIDQFDLSTDIKRDLKYLFDEAPDKENLLYIKSWQQVISTSKLNPLAWVNWFSNKNYTQDVKSMEQHYAYLLLLFKRYKLLADIDLLEKKRGNAQAMLPEAPNEGQTASDSVKRSMIQLIQSYNTSYSGEQCSSLELKQELDKLCLAASNHIARLGSGLKLVQELSHLLSENTRLRTHNNIVHGNELDLTPTQIKRLTEETPDRKIRIQELIRQISLCKDYLVKMQHVSLSDAQTMALNLRKINLKQRGKELRAELAKQPLPKALMEEHEQLETVLPLQWQQLKALLTEPDHEKDDPLIVVQHVPLKQGIEYHQKLDVVHQQILAQLQGMEPGFKQWYQQLFIVLQSQANDKRHYYQAAQLLRDIHFELEYPDPINPYAVLQAYQRLAPSPEKDWDHLLNLKPAVPVVDKKPGALRSSSLNTRLDTLYTHQAGLKNKHPREAILLEQATLNLHQLAHLAEGDDKRDELQNTQACLADPRYDSLQKHRGFLKVVELIAQFITELIRLVSRKADDYRHRFFFIPTCSSQLLQSTSSELISCPA